MSLPEVFQQLDPKLAEALQQAFDQLRSELREEFDQTRRELAGEPAAPPTAPVETAAAEPVSSGDAGDAVSDPLEELKHAVARLDAAGTQGGILTALLEGARRFCSRSAILLVRDDGLVGWDGHGFPGAVDGLRVSSEAGSGWEAAIAGGGSLPLAAAECEALSRQAGAGSPELGLLLPMMLGDRVAALLYADRVDADPSLDVSALQLLAFSAAGILETLPVRNRPATATLRLAEAGAAAAAPAEEPEPQTAAEEAVVEEPEPEPLVEDELVVEEPELEPVVEEPAAIEATEAGEEPEVVWEGAADELESATAGAAPELVTQELPDPIEAPSLDDEPSAVEFPLADTAPAQAEADVERQVDVQIEAEAEEPPAPAEPEQVEPSPAVEPPVSVADTSPELMDRSSTIVSPPGDLDGPGWAFTRTPATTGEEARQEEARRLARLLVTEIKLYNEAQVEIGRREGDLYDRLKEDIDRSRQIFNDRVNDEIRSDFDYFQEALVRILAGGDEDALSE